MDDAEKIAWLGRRVGFGLAPDELEQRAAAGADAFVAELTDPDGAGLPPSADPWAGVDLRVGDPGERRELYGELLTRWLQHMADTRRPLEEWMMWFWHDHFAVSAAAVPAPDLFVDHLRLLRRHALGNYRELLRAVTVDGAMLVFLDGARSTGGDPNENYGRELLELYSVGVDAFDEGDVRAASVALTGWTIRRTTHAVEFVPFRHDATPQELLGVSGVNDVDTVIDAVTGHPSCARFIAGKLATAVLGPTGDDVLAELTAVFADSGLEIAPLVRAIVDHGLATDPPTLVDQPVRWLVAAAKVVGVPLDERAVVLLRGAGQVPGVPPNVGGFPPAATYLSSSAVAARFNASVLLAQHARDGEALAAARTGDHRTLARALGRPAGFSSATETAISVIPVGTDAAARQRLGLALASPDLAVI